jgi:hypothetical protein
VLAYFFVAAIHHRLLQAFQPAHDPAQHSNTHDVGGGGAAAL